MFRAGLFCLLPATLPPLHPVLYPVSCIPYLSCILHWNAHPCIFKISTRDSCQRLGKAKGGLSLTLHLIAIPVGNISADTWFSSRHLSTPYGERYAERSGARNKELCKSCPPAFCVKLCTCADSNNTDTGWKVSSWWVSPGPRGDQISHHGQAALLFGVK